jgi:hypothetical protein
LERTRELPTFFAAVTARYALQFSAMNENVPLCGADQFLLHEKAVGRGRKNARE